MLKSPVNAINIIHQLTVKGDCVRTFVYPATTESNHSKTEGKFGFTQGLSQTGEECRELLSIALQDRGLVYKNNNIYSFVCFLEPCLSDLIIAAAT